MSDEPLLVFLHIPKTAGTTLLHVLVQQSGPGGAVDISGQGWDQPNLAKLTDLSTVERRRLRAISGHFGYGLHEHIDGPAFYVTLLRDPVTRVISQYFHRRRKNPEMAKDMPLTAFVRERVDMHNLQTRMLGGKLEEFAEASELALAVAKRRLEEFPVVGVADRFDESILLLARKFGWRFPFYERQNTNPMRVRIDDLPDGVLAEIVERNCFDVELYRWASERFDEQVRVLGLLFKAQAAAFSTLNRRHGGRISARQQRILVWQRRAQRVLRRASARVGYASGDAPRAPRAR